MLALLKLMFCVILAAVLFIGSLFAILYSIATSFTDIEKNDTW